MINYYDAMHAMPARWLLSAASPQEFPLLPFKSLTEATLDYYRALQVLQLPRRAWALMMDCFPW